MFIHCQIPAKPTTPQSFLLLFRPSSLFPGERLPFALIRIVFLGATGAAKRRKARGWVDSSGPVSHEQLWESLLCELDSPDRVIEWVKVPSHVSVFGNEQADALVNHGRLANPLYPAADTPKGRAARVLTTPQNVPRPLKYKHGNDASLSSTTDGHNASSPSAMGNAGARRALFPQTPPPAENPTQLSEGLGLTLMHTPQRDLYTPSSSSSDYADSTSILGGFSFPELEA